MHLNSRQYPASRQALAVAAARCFQPHRHWVCVVGMDRDRAGGMPETFRKHPRRECTMAGEELSACVAVKRGRSMLGGTSWFFLVKNDVLVDPKANCFVLSSSFQVAPKARKAAIAHVYSHMREPPRLTDPL